MEKMCYDFLTSKEIVPGGWFARQLKIQADGLAGNLDKVWPDVRDSAWIGGKCEGWERVPYWLDGFIPPCISFKGRRHDCPCKKNTLTQF